MKKAPWSTAVVTTAFITISQMAGATTVPFVEHFSADAANWKDVASAPLAFHAVGGPDDSSFVAASYDFSLNAAGDNQTIFRGHDAFDSSGDAFVGNWILDGVGILSAEVRHNAPVPLTYFARLASSANFPGGIAIRFAPVLPNTWTQLDFEISPISSQLFYFEGGNFESIFSNIGNIQLGVTVPDSLAGSTVAYTFDMDQVGVAPVPEPGAICLGAVFLVGLAWRRLRT